MFDNQPHFNAASAQDEQETSGVIVLSMAKRVLHANKAAVGLAGLLSGHFLSGTAPAPALHLSPSLQAFSQRVLIQLEKRIATEDWTQFEIKQILHAAGREFLLRGFGLPDKARRQQSRILLTLQAITRSCAA
jgi:hypothetical protein